MSGPSDDQETDPHDELRELAARIRNLGSIQPADLARAASADLPDGRQPVGPSDRLVEQVVRLSLRLLALVLRSVRTLMLVAGGLAVLDAALFLLPRRDDSAFVVGAVLVLVVLLLPALALRRLGRRFADFRDAVTTFGTKLPNVLTVPDTMVAELSQLAPLMEATARRRLPGRLIGSTRVLLRLKGIISGFVDEHRQLFSATTTVFGYGPQDVLLAVWGVVGIGVLAALVPLLGIWAVLA